MSQQLHLLPAIPSADTPGPSQTNGAVRPIVRKKAALCLLRLMRKSPPDAELLQPEVWSVKLVRPVLACS